MTQPSRTRSRWPIGVMLAALAFVVAVIGAGWALREPPNYDQIEDDLYIGGGVDSPPWRTRAVLNLAEQPDAYTCEVVAHRPIPDGPPIPTLDWLREQVEWVAVQRREGRVFVHCSQGVSRSGLVVTAYLMFEHGWSVDQALDLIRSKRPGVRPNPLFRALLSEWEKELRGRPAAATGAEAR
jgi:hypothetical protein